METGPLGAHGQHVQFPAYQHPGHRAEPKPEAERAQIRRRSMTDSNVPEVGLTVHRARPQATARVG